MTLAVMFTVAIFCVESQAADRNAESRAFTHKGDKIGGHIAGENLV